MNKQLQEIKDEIFRFISKCGVTTYKNVAQIHFNDESDEDKFAELLSAYNYLLAHNDENKGQQRSLPVIIQNEEHIGRFFIQYTSHNYVGGYKSLETGEIFSLGEAHLVSNGETVKVLLSNLWDLVNPNLGKFTSVAYSEDNEDILNNIDF